MQDSWELWSETAGIHCTQKNSLAAMFISPFSVDDDIKNESVTSQSHMQIPGRADLEPRFPGNQARAEACLHDRQGSLEGPAGPLCWHSLSWVWTTIWELASGAWLKPPPGGQLSQGLKPLALSQLPEATPPSTESQGRTFRRDQAPPLPDPVPWKQPDLAMGASPVPYLPGCSSHSVSPFLGEELVLGGLGQHQGCK